MEADIDNEEIALVLQWIEGVAPLGLRSVHVHYPEWEMLNRHLGGEMVYLGIKIERINFDLE